MSSSKFVKIQSQENGAFTDTQNRISFIIPGSMGKISLKDSYVQLYANLSSTEVDPSSGEGVHNLALQWINGGTTYSNHFENVAIVRNARLSTTRQGMVESIREVGVLRQNMGVFRKSVSNEVSDGYLNVNPLKDQNQFTNYSIFSQINKEGDEPSQVNDNTPIMIALEDIMDFCSLDALDTMDTGDIKINLEMNLKNLVPVSIKNTPGDAGNAENAPAGTAVSSLILSGIFEDHGSCPWYVGEKVTFAGTDLGTVSPAIIESITFDTATDKATLTFDRTIFTTTTNQGTDIVMSQVSPDEVSVIFPQAELVIKELPMDTETPKTILYNTYDTFQLNGNNLSNYVDTVELQGRASNALIMPIAPNGIDLVNNAITDIRVSLNNIEIADNRNVSLFTPVYYDNLVRALRNSDYVAKNLLAPKYQFNNNTIISDTFLSPLIAFPLFATSARKNLQVQIESTGTGAVNIYTALPTKIDF